MPQGSIDDQACATSDACTEMPRRRPRMWARVSAGQMAHFPVLLEIAERFILTTGYFALTS